MVTCFKPPHPEGWTEESRRGSELLGIAFLGLMNLVPR